MEKQLSDQLRKAADEIEPESTMPGYVQLFRDAADALDECKKPRFDDEKSLVVEIMALAYLIQCSTSHVVFIGFHGHVNSLDLRVCESKERWQVELFRTEFYINWEREHSEAHKANDPLKWLKIKRDVLKHFLEEGEIPYDEMERVVDEVVSYEF